MKCPKCGQENLEFKVFCGFCRTQLKDFPEMTEAPEVSQKSGGFQPAHVQLRSVNRRLVNSEWFGLSLLILPLLLSLLACPIVSYLAGIGEISPIFELLVFMLIILDLMILAGAIVFYKDWSFELNEGPIRALIAVFLCMSLLIVCIFGSIAIFESTSKYRYSEPYSDPFPSLMTGTIENLRFDSTHRPGISSDYLHGTVIKDVLFYSTSIAAYSQIGIKLESALNCQIEDCIFTGMRIGIEMTDCHDIVVRNCVFSGSTGLVLFDCQNISVVSCTFTGEDYLYRDNSCYNINEEFSTIKNADQLPKYSDFQFPPSASAAEAIFVVLFVIWLFVFGWLRMVRVDEI